MSRSPGADVLGDFLTLTKVGVVGNLSDAQLLDRFLGLRGEAAEVAFEALVTRHGPMVLDVCGNVLRNPHDAQDAFQATFLVLASRAGSIRRRDSLASWLLGVARRVALRSRADVARRRMYERRAAETKVERTQNPPESWPELHAEIGRLPQRYREPVVLCYLEGLSTEAAAQRLCCAHGTVLSRLSRARDRLRRALFCRGLALPTGLLIAGSSPEATRAAIPANMLDATVRASLRFVAQPATAASLSSTTADILARGVIYAMRMTRLTIVAATALAFVLTIGGLSTVARQVVAPGTPRQSAGAEPKADERQDALVRTVDKLQADLDRSAQLNAQLRKEFQDLRANLETLRSSQQVAAPTKAPSGLTKMARPANPQAAQERSYTQVGNLIVAASARGDKVVAYRIDSGEARSLRLGAAKDAPLEVGPVVGSSYVALNLNGPKIARIGVYTFDDSKWYPLELREPVEGQASPIAGQDVVLYSLGRRTYAFSTQAKHWEVAELPDGCSATPSLESGSATLRWESHIYIFNSGSGKWNHIDLDAITAGGGDEGKENTRP